MSRHRRRDSFVAGLFTQVGTGTPTAIKEFATTTDGTAFAPQEVQFCRQRPAASRTASSLLVITQYCIAWQGVFPIRP